jgi:hypothetical protein
MGDDAAVGRSRRALTMAVIVVAGLACAACIATPLADLSTVLLQGLPAWLR